MPDTTPAEPILIENHGLIGDLRTAALVAKDGAIDFFCAPQFDSPAVFASLLDPGAGTFRIAPVDDGVKTAQRYVPDTNVLLTRFTADGGMAELADLMPVAVGAPQRIQRQIRVIRGTFSVAMICAPRFDYARMAHRLEPGGVFRPEGAGPVLRLTANVPLEARDGELHARFDLAAGEDATFVLDIDPGDAAPERGLAAAARMYTETVGWWRSWASQSDYTGRWRSMVTRSALALKLLTSREHGATLAAATFGLPEHLGGERNWDYRYVWIRDASFAMYAFVRLGLRQEASDFIEWISQRAKSSAAGDQLRVAYSLAGENELPEVELPLEGYAGSIPVRIGNEASTQFQLDIYGELMDAVYLANKYGSSISHEGWTSVRSLVDWIGENWRRPDLGIWEGRGKPQHFLHSRLMCWVAVDRAIRLAMKRSLPGPLPNWNALRLEIYDSIHAEYWREDLNSFVQYPTADTPDGSMLLMPLVRFITPQDPRWLGTMAAIEKHLVVDALVYRRSEQDRALDGLQGQEGAFLACSFWYVECLARAGDLAKAWLLFDKLLAYAGPLGLYAEEMSLSGRHLGNYPQALTHLSLISAATYLDRALGPHAQQPWA